MSNLRFSLLLALCVTAMSCAELEHRFPRESHGHGGHNPAYGNQRANADKHYQRAKQFASQGKYAAAESQYRAALKIDPRMRGARGGHGYALYRMGRTDEAIHILRDVVRDFPEYEDAHVWLVEALHAGGHVADAMDHLQAAERLGHSIPGDLKVKVKHKHNEKHKGKPKHGGGDEHGGGRKWSWPKKWW